MKTVLSNSGVEVLYQCTIHFLNDDLLECEYKSNSIGSDLLNYICDYLNMIEREYWGLCFKDSFEQRHWLQMNKLIRLQVMDICPIHFDFKVKIYPPEPYRSVDAVCKHHIFLQLTKDLICGRLFCGPSDSSLLLALVLQHTYGDYDPTVPFETYVAKKIILNQTISTELKAIELHKNHLNGLTTMQTEDLLLRMACQLETYGIDPFLVEDVDGKELNLWINYKGMQTYLNSKKEQEFSWMNIKYIYQNSNDLIVRFVNDSDVTFTCATQAECDYIYQCAMGHLDVFTSCSAKSTIGIVESIVAGNREDNNSSVSVKDIEEILDEDMYVYDSPANEDFDCHKKISWNLNNISVPYYLRILAILTITFGIAWQFYENIDGNSFVFYKKRLRKVMKKYLTNKWI